MARIVASITAAAFSLLIYCACGYALEESFTITLKDGHFDPQSLNLPPNKKLTLIIRNESAEAVEFESFELNREEVVAPHDKAEIHLPELSTGNYDFYDDFHKDVPEGVIVVK